MGIQFNNTPRIEEGYSLHRIQRQAEVHNTGDSVRYFLIPLDQASRASSVKEDPRYANGRAVSDNTKHNWQDELEEEEEVAKGGLLKPFLIALLAVVILGGIGIGAWKLLNPGGSSSQVARPNNEVVVSDDTPGASEPGASEAAANNGSDSNAAETPAATEAPTTAAPVESTPAETTPAETQKATTTMYVSIADGLNVRDMPKPGSEGSTVLTTLAFNTPIEVISSENGWAAFDYNGVTAYVWDEYLSANPN